MPAVSWIAEGKQRVNEHSNSWWWKTQQIAAAQVGFFFFFPLGFWFELQLPKMALTFPAVPVVDLGCSAKGLRGAEHLVSRFLFPSKNSSLLNIACKSTPFLWKSTASELLWQIFCLFAKESLTMVKERKQNWEQNHLDALIRSAEIPGWPYVTHLP